MLGSGFLPERPLGNQSQQRLVGNSSHVGILLCKPSGLWTGADPLDVVPPGG